MMSGAARSKANLHLANGRELIRLADLNGDHIALSSAICLQFEMSLGFYLIELLQTRRQRVFPWPISEESLAALARQFDAPDLQELAALAKDDESWLYRMLRRLALMRRYDVERTVKAEIFQSDLEGPSHPTSVIASSSEEKSPGMDTKLIAMDLTAYEALLHRHRLGHEEY